MEFSFFNINDIGVNVSCFKTGNIDDFFFSAYGNRNTGDFETQSVEIIAAINEAAKKICPTAVCVFKRYFLSDAANYDEILRKHEDLKKCAISVIEQAPLNGSKIAVLAYYQSNIEYKAVGDNIFMAKSQNFGHLWSASNISEKDGSYDQTYALLDDYATNLKKLNCNLELNCIRTWFFIHNIDEYYAGMVKGRNDLFDKHNLIRGNHFISSTGICGRTRYAHNHVMMDAYSVQGIKRNQIKFLQAPTHLNNTQEYGVRFERGTAVDYGDRKEVFISGTASIDNKGNVLYLGDIKKQTLRAIENIDALLHEAGCHADNIAHLIVYLRDFADYAVVNEILNEKYGNCPRVMVLAPVCRPTWLIEMECIALKQQSDSKFENY